MKKNYTSELCKLIPRIEMEYRKDIHLNDDSFATVFYHLYDNKENSVSSGLFPFPLELEEKITDSEDAFWYSLENQLFGEPLPVYDFPDWEEKDIYKSEEKEEDPFGGLHFVKPYPGYIIQENRTLNKMLFRFLLVNGFGTDGSYFSPFKRPGKNEGYENEIFSTNPLHHSWKQGIMRKPTFHYKPTDLKLFWDDYHFNGMFSNRKFSIKEFEHILEHCSSSMEE